MSELSDYDVEAAAHLAEQARQLIAHPLTPARVRLEAVRKLAHGFGFEVTERGGGLPSDDLAVERNLDDDGGHWTLGSLAAARVAVKRRLLHPERLSVAELRNLEDAYAMLRKTEREQFGREGE